AGAPSSQRDHVEEVARRLPAHEGGLGERGGREPEALRLLARPVAPGAVAADTVLGEQRAAALGRRRLRRQRLVAGPLALRDRRAVGLARLATARGRCALLEVSPARAPAGGPPGGCRGGGSTTRGPRVGGRRPRRGPVAPLCPQCGGGGPPRAASPP